MVIDKNIYPLASRQKYCLWMNMPSHHQQDFISALQETNIEIVIRYYSEVDERRKLMGWHSNPQLGKLSKYIRPSINELEKSVPDWQERIHIIPGTIGSRFLMALVERLSQTGAAWVHWSEDVKPGWSRIIRLPLRKRYGKKINRHALGALAISSSAEKEFISWGVAPEKIRWLPYSANALKESHDMNEEINNFIKNRFVFMFIGALCQRKGIDLLLKAFTDIVNHHPNAVLILIGPDTVDAYYRSYSDKLSIPPSSILFTGTVSYEQMHYMLSLCNVFILPSRYDGWGMVIHEGASIGKAVIATERCGAAHHIIVNGLNGFVVKASDANALTEAMRKYLNSPGLDQLHGAHSKIMAEFFYPHKNVERFLCAMESFLKVRNTPAAQS